MSDELPRLKKVLEIKLPPLPEGEELELLAEAAYAGFIDALGHSHTNKLYDELTENEKQYFRSSAKRVVQEMRRIR